MASLIPLSPGLVIAKKFRLDREIARGGMGSVWAAFNTQLEAPVAVKFMAPEGVGSPELVARFQREAKAAAQIRSPHVVQIFEHGMHLGLPFIVMELLEGEDLGSRLRRAERLTIHQAGEIVTQVCKALRRAHEMGIVHRDLKPANVFLARHDDDEVVKVLDFGIAKSLAPSGESDDASTQTGTLVGTPHYMSPEQAQRSKQIDARSDLWSLGVIAYRAVTGRVPFRGDDMINVLVKVCTEAPPIPSSIAPELSPDVDAFFARALCRELAGRFQSAREMADAFSSLLGRRSSASELSLLPFLPSPPSTSSARVPPPPPSSPVSSRSPTPAAAPEGPSPGGTTEADPAAAAAQSARDVQQSSPRDVQQSSPRASIPRETPPALSSGPHSAIPSVPPSGAPLSGEPPRPSIPAPGTLTGATSEAVDLPTALRPAKRRAALVIGGVAAAIAIVVLWSATSSGPPEAITPAATASQIVPAIPTPSHESTPPPAASPAPSPNASNAPNAPAPTATTSAASPSPSASAPSSARPASSLKGTLPRASAAPRSTGAIGGAPKF